MKWLWLIVPGGSLVLGLLWVHRWCSQQEEAEEGAWTSQWQAWAKADPVIPPLQLPAIKPLRATQSEKVTRFQRRMGGTW